MIRLLLVLIIFALIYGSFYYFFSNGGELVLQVQFWELSIPILNFLIIITTLLVIFILSVYVLLKMFVMPQAWYRGFKDSRDEKGLVAIGNTLEAINDADLDKATKHQKDVKKYLGKSIVSKALEVNIKKAKSLKIVKVEPGGTD